MCERRLCCQVGRCSSRGKTRWNQMTHQCVSVCTCVSHMEFFFTHASNFMLSVCRMMMYPKYMMFICVDIQLFAVFLRIIFSGLEVWIIITVVLILRVRIWAFSHSRCHLDLEYLLHFFPNSSSRKAQFEGTHLWHLHLNKPRCVTRCGRLI